MTSTRNAQDCFGFFRHERFPGFDDTAFAAQTASGSAAGVFESVAAAHARTELLWNALADSLQPGVGLFISNSTGKDSTLLTASWLAVAALRVTNGLRVPFTIIGISDTNSEFPEMAARMAAEHSALNAYAEKTGLPFESRLVQPAPRDRLLVEVIGRGKALPVLADGATAPRDGRGWCMDRVKKGPLNSILKSVREQFPSFVTAIGVRTAESLARGKKVGHYASNLPSGLTLVNDGDLGIVPISHWTDDQVGEWMVCGSTPWRPESLAELRAIYHKAATLNEVAGECGLRVTKDGHLSTTCSDLSGTRMGCWLCFMSRNRALQNMAAADARYEWPRRVHRYLYAHHTRNRRRIAYRDALGFSQDTLFPKAFTFRERYWILMLVLRAEAESGFTFLHPEDITAIERAWRREGVWTVDPREAYADVCAWRRTGHPRFSYETHASDLSRTMQILSAGLPLGAYYHLLERSASGKPYFNPLGLAQLVGLTGYAAPLLPQLMAYVFRDTSAPDAVFVMVTDVPSNLGTKLDDDKFNATHLGHWYCAGVRSPSAWEHRYSDGRIAFYRLSVAAASQRIRALDATTPHGALADAVNVLHRNLEAPLGCHADALLADHVDSAAQIQSLHGTLTTGEYNELVARVTACFLVADDLERHTTSAREQLRSEFADRLSFLGESSERGASARRDFERSARAHFCLDERIADVREYLDHVTALAGFIRRGKANAALIERLVYLVQLEAVDAEGGRELAILKDNLLQPADRKIAA